MICENCGKEHNGSYGSGRFCSKECARAFSTKNSQGQLKEANCIDCGKKIYIGKRASDKKCRCEECNKLHFQILYPPCAVSVLLLTRFVSHCRLKTQPISFRIY